MSPSLKKFVGYSLVLHFSISIVAYFSPDISRFLPKREQKITWIKLTKGTGETTAATPFKKVKDMPYWTIKEQKEALKEKADDKRGKDKKSVQSPVKKKEKKEPTQKKTSAEGATNFTQKPKDKREQTIDDALARIQEQLEKRKVEMEAAQVPEDGGGDDPLGSYDVRESDLNQALIAYYKAIKQKINEEWVTTPKQLAEGQMLQTKIDVEISSTGSIISIDYASQSGDISFDLSAKRAVERAAPFPPPPAEILDEVLREGFLIEFNPRSVVGGL